jgi:hypothetical protein
LVFPKTGVVARGVVTCAFVRTFQGCEGDVFIIRKRSLVRRGISLSRFHFPDTALRRVNLLPAFSTSLRSSGCVNGVQGIILLLLIVETQRCEAAPSPHVPFQQSVDDEEKNGHQGKTSDHNEVLRLLPPAAELIPSFCNGLEVLRGGVIGELVSLSVEVLHGSIG